MPSENPPSVEFYRKLPASASFSEATDPHFHADLPQDWWIVVADIIGSTKAIEAGAYKAVNTVGAACIAAVSNIDRTIELPFVFGGDGATFAAPEALRERVIPALRATQRLAREGFGLTLRVGLMAVSDLTRQGHPVRAGKMRLAQNGSQPVLSGSGWEEAERCVKGAAEAGGVLLIDEHSGPAGASFEGFECRWQGVPSFNGHKLALLIAAISPDAEACHDSYQQALAQVEQIYGGVARYHPLRPLSLKTSFNPRLLYNELQVRAGRLSLASRCTYFARMLWENLIVRYLFAFNIDTQATQWSRYRDDLVEHSDFRKFDGMLRMVIDGSDEQCAQLREYLEAEHRAGRLAYGMHKSREALVTCLVQFCNGSHIHFVDGSDGGYALAAKELKKQLASLKSPMRKEIEDAMAAQGM